MVYLFSVLPHYLVCLLCVTEKDMLKISQSLYFYVKTHSSCRDVEKIYGT